MWYTNVDGVIGSKSEEEILNSLNETFESNENLDVGMVLAGGKWVHPPLTIEEIDARLLAIDVKKVRPMSAILAASEGADTSEDLDYLSDLEAQAVALRAQREELVK